MNKEGTEFGLIITDWKSNKPKNFEENHFTKRMYPPFENLPNNALGSLFHTITILWEIINKMLKGTKYENIKLYGMYNCS
jgi:hypothetical protein